MPRPDEVRIVLLGAGNMGFHLGKTLWENDLNIVQIFSRNPQKANELASLVKSDLTTDFDQLVPDADWYILAISDDALEEVAQKVSDQVSGNPLVVHTSGATPSSVLQPYFRRYGIFYALNTFRRETEMDLSTTPICVYANEARDESWLLAQGRKISNMVRVVNDEQRAVLHVAAVFTNNFTNHLYALSEEILADKELSFDFLKPIIMEAARKLQDRSPAEMQTGPAVRGDLHTIERHLAYLEQHHPEMVEIYRKLTEAIRSKHQ